MFKLLKHEFKKRKSLLLIALIILSTAEILAIYQVTKSNSSPVFGAIINIVMFIGVLLIVFVDVVVQYFNDFKKSQGTLLFLSPNSGYKIVGSKMLFGAAELLAGLSLALLFSWITNSFAVAEGYEGIGPQIQLLKESLNMSVGSANTWWVVAGFLFLIFLQYFASQSIAVTSITLGRTILSKNSYNWFWAVLFFVMVSIVVQTVNGMLVLLIGLEDGIFSNSFSFDSQTETAVNFTKYLILGGIEYLFWIAASFLVSGTLLTKKVDI
ncbi:MAG: hypothetical protein JXN65_05880 [Clostridia bacterium]|nr:hypothetical protein [Clostridia bacterium]